MLKPKNKFLEFQIALQFKINFQVGSCQWLHNRFQRLVSLTYTHITHTRTGTQTTSTHTHTQTHTDTHNTHTHRHHPQHTHKHTQTHPPTHPPTHPHTHTTHTHPPPPHTHRLNSVPPPAPASTAPQHLASLHIPALITAAAPAGGILPSCTTCSCSGVASFPASLFLSHHYRFPSSIICREITGRKFLITCLEASICLRVAPVTTAAPSCGSSICLKGVGGKMR